MARLARRRINSREYVLNGRDEDEPSSSSYVLDSETIPSMAFISGSASSALFIISGERAANWLNCCGDVASDGGEATCLYR